jgi:4-amino-4-deoxy-L-arabinose transferase-like glycosyltransferase
VQFFLSLLTGCILANLFKHLDPKSKIQNLKYPALWLLILLLAFTWRTQNLDAFGLSNDEGAHLMWARLAVDGYPLYSQTYAVQPPLFLEWVGLAFRLAGTTIQAGRWAILPGFGLLAVALSWLAYRSDGWPAALAALLLLSLSSLIFTFSRLVMAEVPATALAVISVALIFLYFDQNRKIWLIASGLVLGLSFLFKPLNPFVVVPIGWLLWQEDGGRGLGVRGQWSEIGGHYSRMSGRRSAVRGLLLDALLWSLALALPLIAVPFLYDPAAVYDQLISFRGDLRAAIPGSTAETWEQFKLFITSHWGFWLLAFGGIMATVWSERGSRGAGEQRSRGAEEQGRFSFHPSSLILHPLVWLLWLLAGIAMLWWHTPLFPHHFIVLLPPLILLGAGLISSFYKKAARWLSDPGLRSSVFGRLSLLLGATLIIVAAFNLPALIKANGETAAIVTGGREAEALQLLRAVSAPDDFVMGDSQLLIFMAGRRTPPPLGDVALVAIKARRQTSKRMINLTEQYQSPAIVQWSLRLPWLPDYLAWVDSSYLARRVWDNDHIIYFGLRVPPGQAIPNERMIRLGDFVSVRGYHVEPPQVGQDLNLKVYWQTDTPLQEDYTIFTQLLDPQGKLAASWDSQPLGGYFPTSQWPAHEIVTEIVRLPLPAGLPPGDYTLITGLYRLETLERLRTADGHNDYVTLTTLKLEKGK